MMSMNNRACKRAYLTNNDLIDFLKANAKPVGVAKFTDFVFGIGDLDKTLFWVREIHQNSWPSMKEGKFYPFCKTNIRWPLNFQIFEMPIGDELIECSSLDEAKKYFKKNLDMMFSFKRTAEEYSYQDLSIYIEDIEHIPLTVEIVCNVKKNSFEENMTWVDAFLKEHDLVNQIPHQVAHLVWKNIKK